MQNRSQARIGPKVIHRHRVGDHTVRKVSELVFVRDQPKALLRWVDMGGDRTPVYFELDRSRLRSPKAVNGTFYYDGVTDDPRFEDLEDVPAARPEPARR